jgi:hypothetical protein
MSTQSHRASLEQVVSEESIRQVVEEVADDNKVFREAFRSIDIPDRTGDTFEIPVEEDVLGEPTRREPGAERDYGREEYRTVTIRREEYSSGSLITEQELMDSTFDLLNNHVEQHASAMAGKLDDEAFAVLSDAAPTANAVGSDNGDDMEFDDVIDGMRALEKRSGAGYEGDLLFVGSDAKTGIIKDLANRGTDLGDNTIQSAGIVANYAGVDIAFSNRGLLTNDDAILVDSEFFGYEGEWTGVTTETDSDFDRRAEKLAIFWEGGWVSTQPEAAVRIKG